MYNKSLIATVLFAVFAFPQIFGCAGTELGRSVELSMGADGYQVIAPLGTRTKNVYLTRMALSKDSAVVMPGKRCVRMADNPLSAKIVLEHSFQGTDYAVIRNYLRNNTTSSSIAIIPQKGVDTEVYALLINGGDDEFSIYPAGKEYLALAVPTREDPKRAYVWVLTAKNICGEAIMSFTDIAQGLVYDPNTKTIRTLKELADKSKKSKPKVTKVEEGPMPAAKSVPLTGKEGQPSSASGGSTPSGRSSAPAPQAAPEPVPNGPKVLQDSKPDTQSIL